MSKVEESQGLFILQFYSKSLELFLRNQKKRDKKIT